jgi:hypothetical protein
MEKEKIKLEVIKVLDKFCREHFEEIEMNTEGSLTDTYKYMSLKNVNKALEMCFEETYNKTIS